MFCAYYDGDFCSKLSKIYAYIQAQNELSYFKSEFEKLFEFIIQIEYNPILSIILCKQLSLEEVLFLFTDFQQCLAIILIAILYCNGYYIFPMRCRIFRAEFEKLLVFTIQIEYYPILSINNCAGNPLVIY